MTLSEKIICLRQKSGWSQEMLAEKINVSRQTIAKWEKGLTRPDVDQIITLASLFQVTTDFLLKDDPIIFQDEDLPLVSDNEAQNFLNLRAKTANSTALGVALCILAAIFILTASGVGNLNFISYNISLGIGIILLLITVAAAVGIFIHNSNLAEPYAYLEKSDFALTDQMKKQVESDRVKYRSTYGKMLISGIILCILSVIPIFLGVFFENLSSPALNQVMLFLVSIMLVIIALGVYLIVKANLVKEGYEILLQESDYTSQQKANREKMGAFAPIYWSSITLIYLAFSFFTNHWETSWMIWVFAGIFYSIVAQIISRRKLA